MLSSPHEWDPRTVQFNNSAPPFEEAMMAQHNISTITNGAIAFDIDSDDSTIQYHESLNSVYDIGQLNYSIINSVQISSPIQRVNRVQTRSQIKSERNCKEKGDLLSKSLDIGDTDLPYPSVFQSSSRHSDVSPEDLSERWYISIKTAEKTIKNTTQRFLCSAILPLSRRYRADRMFYLKQLKGHWSTDTIDGRTISLDGNRYAQIFANVNYFAKIYPMDSKFKAGDAFRVFCKEFGIPDELTFDGSKEQVCKNTTFMKQIRKHDVTYHVTEPNLHNQNPAEGVIREIRRKWYRVMIRKQVPTRLWDYCMR